MLERRMRFLIVRPLGKVRGLKMMRFAWLSTNSCVTGASALAGLTCVSGITASVLKNQGIGAPACLPASGAQPQWNRPVRDVYLLGACWSRHRCLNLAQQKAVRLAWGSCTHADIVPRHVKKRERIHDWQDRRSMLDWDLRNGVIYGKLFCNCC